MSPRFSAPGIPQYHDDKLIVKMAPQAAEPLANAFNARGNAAMELAAVEFHPGLSILSRYERSGRIIRAIPLSRKVGLAPSDAGPGRVMASLAMSVLEGVNKPSVAADTNAGVSILELADKGSLEELHKQMENDPNIEFVARVPVRYLCVPKSRRRMLDMQPAPAAAAPVPAQMWNLAKIRWEAARSLAGFQDAAQIKVAVLDTGIDVGHPDLQGTIANYVYAHPLVADASGPKDYIGHGTHVSGTIAAGINQLGINGICRCQLFSWKIFHDAPDYSERNDHYFYYVDPTMYQRALADCADEGINVINLSIGGPGAPDPNERALFDNLLNRGTIIVAAMGNERQSHSPTSYPAAIPGVIAVGATRITDEVTNFSNRGPHISISAPGETIWSTLPTYEGQTGYYANHSVTGQVTPGAPDSRETNYAAWDGTSMASPHVTAASALLLAKSPGLTPAQVRERLMSTADRVPGMGTLSFHQDYGAGRLNLLTLLT